MSEITKLYENAEIKKHITCDHANCPQYGAFGRDKCAIKTRIPTEECIKNKEYTTAEYVYPPLTAKKQLELIKWCLDNYRGYIFDSIETEWFEEQLCAFINNLWQDLTDTEKAEIKEILNEY